MTGSLFLLLTAFALSTAQHPIWRPRYSQHYSGYAPWYRRPYPGYHGYRYNDYYEVPRRNEQFHAKLRYFGKLTGSCENAYDGLYYVDDHNFAFCSNGQKSVQPCAEGSANPPLEYFQDGGYYGFSEFCTVNLLMYGYKPLHFNPAHKEYINKPKDRSELEDKSDEKAEENKSDVIGEDSKSAKSEPAYRETNHFMSEEKSETSRNNDKKRAEKSKQ